GFGWEWGEDLSPVEAPRFNLVMTLFLLVALLVGLLGIDPLQLTLYGSMFTALVLPIALGPYLVLMNDEEYLGDKTNGRLTNYATIGILVIAFLVALASVPLLVLTGGGG
ncbi:MAG: divalent metal cation transporter, partial [Chloroflexota bacterium]|nr:divalent metal cation transporter [Chloroflexota bacterium]